MRLITWTFIGLTLSASALAVGIKHSDKHSMQHGSHGNHQPSADARVEVVFPAKTYDETLASMREHLRAVDLVIASVADGDYEKAATAAEKGLGIGHQHGVDGLQSGHSYMPPAMLSFGSAMHMNARELVVTLRDAEVTGDVAKVMSSLNNVTKQCVGCHDAFKLKRGD
jgi:hypothetical protein